MLVVIRTRIQPADQGAHFRSDQRKGYVPSAGVEVTWFELVDMCIRYSGSSHIHSPNHSHSHIHSHMNSHMNSHIASHIHSNSSTRCTLHVHTHTPTHTPTHTHAHTRPHTHPHSAVDTCSGHRARGRKLSE